MRSMRFLAYFGVVFGVLFGLSACGGGGGGSTPTPAPPEVTANMVQILQEDSVISENGSIQLVAQILVEDAPVTNSVQMSWSVVTPNVMGSGVVASVGDDGVVSGISEGEVLVRVDFSVDDEVIASDSVSIVVGEPFVLAGCAASEAIDVSGGWLDVLANQNQEVCASVNGDLEFSNIPDGEDFPAGLFRFVERVSGNLLLAATDENGSVGFENLREVSGVIALGPNVGPGTVELPALVQLDSGFQMEFAVDGSVIRVSEELKVGPLEYGCDVYRVVLGPGDADHLDCDGDTGLSGVNFDIDYEPFSVLVTPNGEREIVVSPNVNGDFLPHSVLRFFASYRNPGDAQVATFNQLAILEGTDNGAGFVQVNVGIIDPDNPDEHLFLVTGSAKIGEPKIVANCDAGDVPIDLQSSVFHGFTDAQFNSCVTLNGDVVLENVPSNVSDLLFGFVGHIGGDLLLDFPAVNGEYGFFDLESIGGDLIATGNVSDEEVRFDALRSVSGNFVVGSAPSSFQLVVSDDVVIGTDGFVCDLFRVALGPDEAGHLDCTGDNVNLSSFDFDVDFNFLADVISKDVGVQIGRLVTIDGESSTALSLASELSVLTPGGSFSNDNLLTTSDNVRESLIVQLALSDPDGGADLAVVTRDFRVGAAFRVPGCGDASDLDMNDPAKQDFWVGITNENDQLCLTINGELSFDLAAVNPPIFFLNHIQAITGGLDLTDLVFSNFDYTQDEPIFSNLRTIGGELDIDTAVEGLAIFPKLTDVGGEVLFRSYSSAPHAPEFPVLERVGVLSSDRSFFDGGFLEMAFPELLQVDGAFEMDLGQLVTFNAPLVSSIGNGFAIYHEGALSSLSLPNLEEVLGTVYPSYFSGYADYGMFFGGYGSVDVTFSALSSVEGPIGFIDSNFNIAIPSDSVSIDDDGCFAYQQSLDDVSGTRNSFGVAANITCF